MQSCFKCLYINTSETPTSGSFGLTSLQKTAIVGGIILAILVIGGFAAVSYSPNRASPVPATPNMRIEVNSTICWTGNVYGSGSSFDVQGCGSNSWNFSGATYVTGDFHLRNKCSFDIYGNYSCESASLTAVAYHTDGTVCKQASTTVQFGSVHVTCSE